MDGQHDAEVLKFRQTVMAHNRHGHVSIDDIQHLVTRATAYRAQVKLRFDREMSTHAQFDSTVKEHIRSLVFHELGCADVLFGDDPGKPTVRVLFEDGYGQGGEGIAVPFS